MDRSSSIERIELFEARLTQFEARSREQLAQLEETLRRFGVEPPARRPRLRIVVSQQDD